MKIAVVGLGAVGGLIAARLTAAGHRVAALTRGATLAAVRADGLRLIAGEAQSQVSIDASEDARELGLQDLVIVAVKSQALGDVTAAMRPLIGPQTTVMPAMNGVPWWFLQTLPAASAPADRRLVSVDPDARIESALPLEHVLGCVVHLTSSSPAPGIVRHGFGDRLIVGEPAGGDSARAATVCDMLGSAGFTAQSSADIRHDIWYKLWGNMTMNPVSALTGAASDRILEDPLVHAFILRTMEEARLIGERIGCPITQGGEERMAVARQLGSFKTSMLQDAIAGRGIELDALVGAVREIGLRLEIPTPNIDALLGLTRLMARERGLYPSTVTRP